MQKMAKSSRKIKTKTVVKNYNRKSKKRSNKKAMKRKSCQNGKGIKLILRIIRRKKITGKIF